MQKKKTHIKLINYLDIKLAKNTPELFGENFKSKFSNMKEPI